MSFYQRHVLPPLIHLAMKNRDAEALRRRLLPAAEGRVLEIGVGSGLNLPHYGPGVEALTALDPSPELLARARKAAAAAGRTVDFVDRGAEAIPCESGAFDTVVTTWTLCSIAEAERALAEVRRVLAPGGRLLFVEHGLAPAAATARWQDRLNPLWRRFAGGCNLNRPIDRLIAAAGFALDRLETGHLVRGPRPFTFTYMGAAQPG